MSAIVSRVVGLRQHRKIFFIVFAVILSLLIIREATHGTTVQSLSSRTSVWGKGYASKLATPLYGHSSEVQVPLNDEEKKDPCYEVPLPAGSIPQKTSGSLVLVTGGGGFIGSNLVDKLVELGYRVRVLDNLYTGFIRNVPLHQKNVEFVFGDILDPEILKTAVVDVEYIFHLAAMSKVLPSMKDPEMAKFCTENNAIGTWNVLNATRAKRTVKKVIYAGSSTFYGNKPIPHQEDMAPDFLTPYAASKYEGEIQMQMFDRIFDVPTIINRFFMVYGPRQPTTGAYAIVTGVFARQAAHKQPLTIEGDGSHFRDFIHVQDIVKGLILSQQRKDLRGGSPINLGSGTHFSVKQVADLISETQTHVAERKNDLVGTLADTCRMKKVLNYKTSMDFKKEMATMAQETMKGNVFAQEWLTPLHALSVPHTIPVGSPILPWPESGALDALLNSFKTFDTQAIEHNSSFAQEKSYISVLVLDGKKDELETKALLLMNTVYSLVRFGQAKRYVVVASGDAFTTCREWNFPCVKSEGTGTPFIVEELLKSHDGVHISRVGTTYTRSLIEIFSQDENTATTDASGDVFIQAVDATRNAVRKWVKATKSQGTQIELLRRLSSDFHAKNGALSNLSAHTIESSTLCPTSTTPAPWQTTNCPKGSMVTLSCGANDHEQETKAAISALKRTGLWQLSDCTNGKYCDKQQNVPLKWLAHPPDLSTSGSWCS